MEKLSTYNSQNIPLSPDGFGKLFIYLSDREVIIYFNRDEPYYHVQYVAVCMVRTETYDIYDLYQHEYINESDENVKSVIKEIVEKILEQ
jgi:hypothetical protein